MLGCEEGNLWWREQMAHSTPGRPVRDLHHFHPSGYWGEKQNFLNPLWFLVFRREVQTWSYLILQQHKASVKAPPFACSPIPQSAYVLGEYALSADPQIGSIYHSILSIASLEQQPANNSLKSKPELLVFVNKV